MRHLRRSLRLYIVGVVLISAATLAATIVCTSQGLSQRDLMLGVLVATLASLTYSAPIKLAAKRTLVLDIALRIVAIAALPPAVAAVAVGVSVVAGNAYLRRPWFNLLFNAAQEPLAVLVAALVYRALTPVALADPHHTLRSALALLPASLALYLVSTLIVDGITALQYQRSPFVDWVRIHTPSITSHAVLTAIGGVVATNAVRAPWTLLLAIAPVAVGRTLLHASLGLDEATLRLAEQIAGAIDAAYPSTPDRSQRVATLATQLAEAVHLPPEEQRRVYLAALLHNVALLLHPEGASLSDKRVAAGEHAEEWRAVASARWIAATLRLPGVADAVRYQAARFDGRSGAGRLGGTDIPLEARILAVSVAWIDLTTVQAYRPALSESQAALVLHADAGRKWDPALAEILLHLGGDSRLSVTASVSQPGVWPRTREQAAERSGAM